MSGVVAVARNGEHTGDRCVGPAIRETSVRGPLTQPGSVRTRGWEREIGWVEGGWGRRAMGHGHGISSGGVARGGGWLGTLSVRATVPCVGPTMRGMTVP
jgi:hypothetical protein